MTTLMRAAGIGAAAVLLGGSVFVRAQSQPAGAAAKESVDYAKDIEPIFKTYCYECHGPKKARGRLRLTTPESIRRGGTSGAVITPGKSADSLMIHRVLGLDGDDRMPLDGDPLPADAIARLRAWIDQGARASSPGSIQAGATATAPEPEKVEEHWAYVKPSRPPLPTVKSAAWIRNPIDQFVLARLERRGARTRTRGLEGDAASASDAGSDRVAADDRRTRRLPRRLHARGVRTRCRPAARVPPLRRAMGPPMARPRPLRRHERLRERQPARDLEVPRLGHRRAQSRPAVRRVHDRADRRRHAAGRDDRTEDCQRLPPQCDDERGGGRRSGGVEVRSAGRPRQHDRRRSGWGRRLVARSATTTSTIRSARRTTSGCSRFSRARLTTARRSAMAPASSSRRWSSRAPNRRSRARQQQAEIDRLEQELKAVTPAVQEAQSKWEESMRSGFAGWTPLVPQTRERDEWGCAVGGA